MNQGVAAVPVKPGAGTFQALVRSPVLVVWALYLASIPIYVGASGLPQPGNALLFVLVPLALKGWNGKLPASIRRTLRPLAWFTAWVFVVNFSWALIHWKWGLQDYVLHPLYYIFNAVVFFTALVIYQRHGEVFVRVTGYVVIGVVLFQVVASVVSRGDVTRGTLFFNNPNQLGYYALLSACLIALVQRPVKMSIVTASIALTGCTYLSVLSASRAATAGIGILFVLLVFSNPRLIIVGIIAAVGLLAVGGPIASSMDYSQRRALLERDPNADFVEERGYDRLWDYKEHLLLGAGEGDVERFSSAETAREIHSSAATVLFSYGVVGATLFLLFALRVITRAHLRSTVILVPTFAYTIAHQGLRFTMLWVLLAVFVACKVSAGRRPTGSLAKLVTRKAS